jgi:hypothetical protein
MSLAGAHLGAIAGAPQSRTSAPPPPDPSLVARPDLPFDVPTAKTLAASPFKVWSHYFTPFPITLQGDWTKDVDNRLDPATGKSIDTADFIDHRWMPLGSIEGGIDNRVFGGLMRDAHKLRRAKRTSQASPTLSGLTLTWQIQDKMHEVRDAIKGGLDGFTLDILKVPQTTSMPSRYDYAAMPDEWRKCMWLFEAVGEVNRQDGTNLRIVSMPDGTTSATKNSSTLARAMIYIARTYPNVAYFEDGRFDLAPFQAEGGAGGIGLSGLSPHDFWSDVLRRIRADGIATYFWPCYQKQWTDWHPQLTSLAYGASLWGDRDAVRVIAEGNRARRAHHFLRNNFSTTQRWMHPVAPGDQRPREARWWEQNHTRALDGAWQSAIGDTTAKDANGDLLHRKAHHVQVVTWSDFPEAAHVCPSRAHGFAMLAVNWWWLIQYKTGVVPTILRDELYLSHRIQPTDGEPNTTVTYSSPYQTKFFPATPEGDETPQETVGATAFLATDAQVIINMGGTDYDKGLLAAGRHVLRAPLVPIGSGTVSARIVRGGVTVKTVTSPHTVSLSQSVQDYQYRMVKTLPDPA